MLPLAAIGAGPQIEMDRSDSKFPTPAMDLFGAGDLWLELERPRLRQRTLKGEAQAAAKLLGLPEGLNPLPISSRMFIGTTIPLFFSVSAKACST